MHGKLKLLGPRSLAMFVMLSLCLSIFLTQPTHAASVPNSGLATAGRVAQNQQRVTAYWTPQRLKSAQNADVLVSGAVKGAAIPATASQGVAKAIAPAAPANKAHASVAPTTNAIASPQDFSYPFPFSRFAVNTASYTSWPFSANGKVFFTDSRTGGNFVCSGTSVNSHNLSVVDTAGHCVVQGGSTTNWYTNWVFCPAYLNGSCQLGLWFEFQPFSYSFWSVNNQFEYDLAAVVVSPNNGVHVVNAVGGEGIGWNFSRNQSYTAFGYPQAAPFDGSKMIECTAPFATTSAPDGTGTPMTGIGCDMTGGASGGGWLFNFGSGGGIVNGHNDWKYFSQPLAMYSPYYGNEEATVFNAAQAVVI